MLFAKRRKVEKMDRKKMVNIRGLAVLGVILIHVTANNFQKLNLNLQDGSVNLFINTVVRYSVPVFFISSGIGISSSYYKYKSALEFYKNRFKILPDFIFWSVIYFFLNNFQLNIKSIIKIFIGKSYYHMYFIPALFTCYFLYPIIEKNFYSRNKLFLLIGLGLFWQFLYYKYLFPPYFQLIGFIPYFLLGVLFQKNSRIFFKMMNYDSVIFILGMLILFFNTFYDYYLHKNLVVVTSSLKPTVFVYSLGVFLFIIRRCKSINKFLDICDRNSMNIYYIHPAIILLLNELNINSMYCDNIFISIVLTSVIVLLVPLFISMLIKYIKNLVELKKSPK